MSGYPRVVVPGVVIFLGARLRAGARASWSNVLGEMRMCDNSSYGDITAPSLALSLFVFAPLPNQMPLAQ